MAPRTVARIAHLSDLHLLGPRPRTGLRSYGLDVRLVSLGRRLDAPARRERCKRAIRRAKELGADHFVFSGDLTEVGAPTEFEALAEVLHESELSPDSVTLVPGNHDAYTSEDGWKRALEGPLAPYKESSACRDGHVVERAGFVVLPVDVTMHQPVTRSAGYLSPFRAEALGRRLSDPGLRKKATVVVQHHPPFPHALRAWQWVDGLAGVHHLYGVLARHRGVHILHGHLHRAENRLLESGSTQVFGAPATVEAHEEKGRGAPFRLYQLRDNTLESQGIFEA